MENFKSIHIDLEKGIYLINGKDIKNEPIIRLDLKSHNGEWKVEYEVCLSGTNKKELND